MIVFHSDRQLGDMLRRRGVAGSPAREPVPARRDHSGRSGRRRARQPHAASGASAQHLGRTTDVCTTRELYEHTYVLNLSKLRKTKYKYLGRSLLNNSILCRIYHFGKQVTLQTT